MQNLEKNAGPAAHWLRLALLSAALALPNMASARSVAVTRFHLGEPIAAQPVTVELADGFDPESLESQAWATAMVDALAKAGFAAAATPAGSPLVARLRLAVVEAAPRPPRFSIGIGMGGGNRNVGIGGAVNLPIDKARQMLAVTLTMRLHLRADGRVLWEGRAEDLLPAGQLTANAPRLATALLSNFPGPSGKTTKVNPKP